MALALAVYSRAERGRRCRMSAWAIRVETRLVMGDGASRVTTTDAALELEVMVVSGPTPEEQAETLGEGIPCFQWGGTLTVRPGPACLKVTCLLANGPARIMSRAHSSPIWDPHQHHPKIPPSPLSRYQRPKKQFEVATQCRDRLHLFLCHPCPASPPGQPSQRQLPSPCPLGLVVPAPSDHLGEAIANLQ